MTRFTPDAAARLPGPEWLQRSRAQAAEVAAGLALPSTDEEVWRYSRIGELDLDRYRPATADDRPDGLPDQLRARLRELPPHAGGLVAVNGYLVHRHLDQALAEQGVVVAPVAELADGAELAAVGEPNDALEALADAFVGEPLVIRVPAGVTVPKPLVVVTWLDGEDLAVFPRVIVEVGADAEVTILEVAASPAGSVLSVPRLDLRVGAAARVRHLGIQDLGSGHWRLGHLGADVGSQASLVSAHVALGGGYARLRTDCRLTGRGASGDLLALYFAASGQLLDFRTFQQHEAPDTTSNLLFKGAVGGHGRSVYTGLIRVHPEARGTNAFQTNRTLKLGEDAWAESVPNLEIENNDVRCSHASTVGPVDPEQRFYLESRGVPLEVAERLLVSGFFDEVLDRLPVAELRPALRARLVDRYEAVETGSGEGS